jgi:hypothetical protein
MRPHVARFAIPLAAAAILAAGCASRTGAAGPGPSPTSIVPVTLSDQGKVISVQVGQVVQVSLGKPVAGYAWTVATYPHSILAIASSDPKQGTFTFRARSKGQGLVGFTKFGRCGPPLPAAQPEGAMCPAEGKGLQPGFPVRPSLVTYTVRVS